MRIAKLDLTRFGKFTDHTLEFAADGLDLHLIVGDNEAGKSTLRQAVLDLFYGIPVRTPYGFKHGMTELVIGGTLERDGETLAFQRFKRNKNPLIGADGEPFPEADLLKWLGGTDREFFERNFGLDHQTLAAGAQQILDSSGDVGQMLFQAAAGISTLHNLRQKLESEAYALWGERRRGEAAYYAGLKRCEEAEATLREVGVSAHKWQTAKRALDTAVTAAEESQTAYRNAETRRERLERIRRVAPFLSDMRIAQVEREHLGTPAALPPDAAKTFDAAEAEIARAAVEERLLGNRRQQQADALAALCRRPALIAHKALITALAGRVTEFVKATNDLPGVQGQVEANLALVRGNARQLGWIETEPEAIAAKWSIS